MSDRNRDDAVERFEDRLREWGRRPGGLTARIARTRVVAHLPEPARQFPWMRMIAAR